MGSPARLDERASPQHQAGAPLAKEIWDQPQQSGTGRQIGERQFEWQVFSNSSELMVLLSAYKVSSLKRIKLAKLLDVRGGPFFALLNMHRPGAWDHQGEPVSSPP